MVLDRISCLAYRKYVEKENVYEFPFCIPLEGQRKILYWLLHNEYRQTNDKQYYHLVTNNCGAPLLRAIEQGLGLGNIPAGRVVLFGPDAVLSHLGVLPRDVATHRHRYEITPNISLPA